MKRSNLKRKIVIASSIGIIATTATIGCSISAVTTTNNNDNNFKIKSTQQNNSFNINTVSTKWVNNTSSEHAVTNYFDEILNYNKNKNQNIKN